MRYREERDRLRELLRDWISIDLDVLELSHHNQWSVVHRIIGDTKQALAETEDNQL